MHRRLIEDITECSLFVVFSVIHFQIFSLFFFFLLGEREGTIIITNLGFFLNCL